MANYKFAVSLFLVLLSTSLEGAFLRISGKDFYYGDAKVFLSGVNIAWNSYGFDFGNGNYASSGPVLEQWIRDISAAGGNSLRIWLHVEGDSTPQFDSDGYVTAPDQGGNLINDLSRFLDVAAENNVLVIPVLWNGALMRNDKFVNLVWDDSKLQSYIDNALKPMVQALASKPALGAWEIMNEPEGSVRVEGNANPCYDTTVIGQYGAGWTGASIPMERFLSFINRQSAAVRQVDPKALVTVGSWSEHAQNDAFSDSVNHYKDECLVGAGGQSSGIIDFYQMHTYSWEGTWNTNAPFKKPAFAYQLPKPLVIGEFAAVCAENEGVAALWDFSYNNGYGGVWSWQYNAGGHCSDSKNDQDQGMTRIKSYTHNGAIPITVGSVNKTKVNHAMI